MAYRDELEAAQRRIADLEGQVHDLKHPHPPEPQGPLSFSAMVHRALRGHGAGQGFVG